MLMLISDSTISDGKSYAIFYTYNVFINSFFVRYEAPKNINTRMGHKDQVSGRVGDRSHVRVVTAVRSDAFLHGHAQTMSEYVLFP